MGRNAKLYKSHKSKKKQSSTQEHVSAPLAAEGRGKSMKAGQESITAKSARFGGGIDKKTSQNDETIINDTNSHGNRLKSKLWRDLEAKRAKEGKGEYTTPKEAGIDYLRQWEKRGR